MKPQIYPTNRGSVTRTSTWQGNKDPSWRCYQRRGNSMMGCHGGSHYMHPGYGGNWELECLKRDHTLSSGSLQFVSHHMKANIHYRETQNPNLQSQMNTSITHTPLHPPLPIYLLPKYLHYLPTTPPPPPIQIPETFKHATLIFNTTCMPPRHTGILHSSSKTPQCEKCIQV